MNDCEGGDNHTNEPDETLYKIQLEGIIWVGGFKLGHSDLHQDLHPVNHVGTPETDEGEVKIFTIAFRFGWYENHAAEETEMEYWVAR